MQLVITGVNPDTQAVTLRALKVCNSYMYVLDQVLLPTRSNGLSTIPDVNATFLQALASLGNTNASSSNTSVGSITDPVSISSRPTCLRSLGFEHFSNGFSGVMCPGRFMWQFKLTASPGRHEVPARKPMLSLLNRGS